jgi:hypothetical protein
MEDKDTHVKHLYINPKILHPIIPLNEPDEPYQPSSANTAATVPNPQLLQPIPSNQYLLVCLFGGFMLSLQHLLLVAAQLVHRILIQTWNFRLVRLLRCRLGTALAWSWHGSLGHLQHRRGREGFSCWPRAARRRSTRRL